MFPLLQSNEQILGLMKTLSNGSEKAIRDSDRVRYTPPDAQKMLESTTSQREGNSAASPLGHLKQMLSVKTEEGEEVKQEKVEVKQEDEAASTKVEHRKATSSSSVASGKGFLSFSVSAILAKAEIREEDGGANSDDGADDSPGEKSRPARESARRKAEQKKFLEEHQHRIGSLLSAGSQGMARLLSSSFVNISPSFVKLI